MCETRLNAHCHTIDVLIQTGFPFKGQRGEMGEVLTSKYSLHVQYGMSYVVYIECYLWRYESEYNRYFNIRQLVM